MTQIAHTLLFDRTGTPFSASLRQRKHCRVRDRAPPTHRFRSSRSSLGRRPQGDKENGSKVINRGKTGKPVYASKSWTSSPTVQSTGKSPQRTRNLDHRISLFSTPIPGSSPSKDVLRGHNSAALTHTAPQKRFSFRQVLNCTVLVQDSTQLKTQYSST